MKVKKTLKTLTPRNAESFLAFNTFEGQRNMSESIVQEYVEKIHDGRFHTGSVALVHGNFGTRLVDGQKTLKACVTAGKPVDALIQEFTLNGEASTHELECARLFSQFAGGQARTALQMSWMYGCQLGWTEWQRQLVGTLASALAAIECGRFSPSEAARMSKDSRAALLPQHEAECVWIHDIYNIHKKPKHIARSPVIAAMLLSFRTSQKAATEFWLAVRDGAELKKGDARLTLRDYLTHVKLRGGMSIKVKDSPREVHVKCAHAWNAWRQGKSTSLRYDAEAPNPKFR